MSLLNLIKQEMNTTETEHMEVKLEEHPIKTEPGHCQQNEESEKVNYRNSRGYMIESVKINEKNDKGSIQLIPEENNLHQCNHCSKTFKIKSFLDKHQLTHSWEKQYQCTNCNKVFAEKTHLVYHLRTHTGEKPFK